MRTSSPITLAAITTASLITSVSCDKDSSYYPYPNFVNPNTYLDLYWKDAENVIEDMDQFSALYIKHHGCVWSASSGKRREGGGGDDDYWYLGGPQRFRANAAYSLYGILKNRRDTGCNKHTYINSFFTTAGVETLAYPFGVDLSYVDTSCGNDKGSKDRALMQSSADFERDVVRARRHRMLEDADDGDDDGDDIGYNGENGYSYGTGCTANYKYVSDTFGGGYCDGSIYIETTDELEDFNAEMNALSCEKIYDKSEDSSAYNSNAFSILSYSRACDRNLYSNACPDPHGLLSIYNRNLEKAMNLAAEGKKWRKSRSFPFAALTSLFTVAGVGLFMYSKKIKPVANQKKNIELPPMEKNDNLPHDAPHINIEVPLRGSFGISSKSSSAQNSPTNSVPSPTSSNNGTDVDKYNLPDELPRKLPDKPPEEDTVDKLEVLREETEANTLAAAVSSESQSSGRFSKLKKGFTNRFSKK